MELAAENDEERQWSSTSVPVNQSIGVLTLGEAAARLSMNRRELDALIDAGKIEVLPAGFTRTIPTTEVERLIHSGVILKGGA